MFERLFIEVAEQQNIQSINLNVEIQKLLQVSTDGKLERIIKSSDFSSYIHDETIQTENEEQQNDDLAEMIEDFKDSDSLETEVHE